MMRGTRQFVVAGGLVAVLAVGACGKKQQPVVRPIPPPPPMGSTTTTGRPPAPPEPVSEPVVVPSEPAIEGAGLGSRSLEELNRSAPLHVIYFEFDSSEITQAAQQALTANADTMKRNTTWIVTIEGHCDERGTVEYNLALGERRAAAARAYLQSLGIGADRMKTISYGKEFPVDPGHSEEAWSRNRRAQFVITAK